MSKVERKEYQETKVTRTLSPTRNYSSNQNLSQFDSNLDYLLEDLQNSVSRPGSSLGYTNGGTGSHAYRDTTRAVDTGRSNSLSRISNIKSSNPMSEYSSDDTYSYKSPDGRQTVSGYKKEKYMYGTSTSDITPEKLRAQNSINQLDNLLDDLQQVKNSSFLKTESYNSSGPDPNYQSSVSKKNVNRELHYGDTPLRTQTLEREGETIKRDIQYLSEGTYKERTTRPVSPVVNSRTSTLSKQTKVSNIHDYPVEVVETVAPEIDAEVLAHIDPNLRPPGNTKVTTTIKTYTYEIPGSGEFPTNLTLNDSSASEQKYVYSPNQTITTPSKSFVYNKVENKENTVYQDYPPYQKPTSPGGVLVKETITTRNYQPGYRVDRSPPTTNQTYIYNETNQTTENVENGFPPPPPPPSKETYIFKESNTVVNKKDVPRYPDNYPPGGKDSYYLKETHTTTNKNDVPFSERGYPVYNPPDGRNTPSTTYYLKETHNTSTTNRPGSPYQNGYPPSDSPNKTIIYKNETQTTNNTYGPNRPKTPEVESFDPKHPPYPYKNKPNEPINIHYSYKSTSKTENNYKGGYPNGETELLLPKKFPTDDGPDGPPKKLDDLMATIGHEPPTSPLNVGFLQAEQERAHQKKADTLKRQATEAEDLQKKEPPSKTKNVSGPPVYYPPGDMFLKKEEGEAAWRAQGGYAKASGKYQYEAESKSKSKSSSGATVVPVCLPLCCGLPCTIL
ncbi:unnamed protein product [Psylliodes chrysocephalus]|uniref:Uncharacterized protein n=1 Tax=Psylliodes chrysocephalus TaxID=3402493 RepID=A0A9P0D0I9_9CUCU|nr:unnamed protein product [Psylliodes chrysocephala]